MTGPLTVLYARNLNLSRSRTSEFCLASAHEEPRQRLLPSSLPRSVQHARTLKEYQLV